MSTTGQHQDQATTPLLGLLRNDRAERAFLRLGITTVEQFLATPKEQLLAVPGFGKRTYQRVLQRIESMRTLTSPVMQLLPQSLLELSLLRAALPPDLVQRLAALGAKTLGQVYELPASLFAPEGELGIVARQRLRAATERLVRVGIDQVDTPVTTEELDFPTLRARLLAPLSEAERDLFCDLVGLCTLPRSPGELVVSRQLQPQQLAQLADGLRLRLHERAPSLLGRLQYELLRELQAFEGVVTGEHLAPGTLAHALSRATGDPLLPLRLGAFCFPTDFHLVEGVLTGLPARTCRRLQRRLRQLTAPARLPLPFDQLTSRLRAVVDPPPRGLLLHLLQRVQRLSVQLDEKLGEVVTQGARSVAARLFEILREEGRPLLAIDLAFFYRERYRRVRLGKILRHLQQSPAFVEIGPAQWALRTWMSDALDAAAVTARRVVAHITDAGGKLKVIDMLAEQGLDQRAIWLTLDCMKRDASVRYLGRGEFCPATQQRSQVLAMLLRDFRRAAGEVVFSRFVDNQPPEHRRLVEHLLRENRLFLLPAPDRIDVLTNYPFNEQRMRWLLELTEQHLRARSGYASLASVQQEVNTTDLGGSWLTTELLGELLRRHGRFELLPSGIVALRELGLIGWLQARARAALRTAGLPMSVAELLVEQPELAEFGPCLEELLQRDPMVRPRDDARYQLV